MGQEYQTFEQDNVIVEFSVQDRDFVQNTCAHVREAVRLLADWFALDETFPAIKAILVPDRPEYDRCVSEVLKVEIETPSHPARVAQPQGNQLVILSPSAYESPYHEYSADGYRRLVFHEVVHIVEEYLSPNIEAVQRWWSEGLAIYLSDQWKYDEKEKTVVLEGIAKRSIPAIEEMQGQTGITRKAVRLSYMWGWTIVKYIDCVHGRTMLQRIVEKYDDGNVFRVLAQEPQDFERAWREWLLKDARCCILSA